MRGDAFIHFVCGSRRVNIRLGVLLLIPKSPRNHLTVCKKISSGLFKNVMTKCVYISYIQYIYIYIYIYICVCVCVCVCIYIYEEKAKGL